MSVHDVAAVDRLNSLRRPKKSGDKNLNAKNETSISRGNRSPYHASLPTSPTRDGKSDGDTLRRAMARHQASLSRPESPIRNLNDDLPSTSHKYPSYSRLPPMSSPLYDRRTRASPSLRRRDGYRTVSSTGTTSSARSTPGLEETKSSLRNSQIILDELDSNSSITRPSMDKTSSLHVEGSPELSTTSYPYLSNSTYSLPRNHRLYKSNRQFAASLRESQESLLSSSRESLVPESRESLLKRYPSSSLRSTPVCSPDRYSSEKPSNRQGSVTSIKSRGSSPTNPDPLKTQTSFKLQTPFSPNSFQSEFYNQEHSLTMESGTACQTPTYRQEVRGNKYEKDPLHLSQSSTRSSRNNSPVRNKTPHYCSNEPLLYKKSSPVSPAYSLRSSRAASPTDSWRSGREISETGSYYSSKATSHSNSTLSRTNPQRSSKAASPAHSTRSNSGQRATITGSLSRESENKKTFPLVNPYKLVTPEYGESPLNICPRQAYIISSKTTSPASSVRSSRAASPNRTGRKQAENINLDSELEKLVRLAEQQSNPLSQVIYVRETFQVVPACLNQRCNNCTPDTSSEHVFEINELPGHRLVKLGIEEPQLLINTSRKSRACSQDKDISGKEAEINFTPGKHVKECSENTHNEGSSEYVTEVFETNELPGHRLVNLGAEESHIFINPSHRACSQEVERNVTPGRYVKEWSENTNNENKKQQIKEKSCLLKEKNKDENRICYKIDTINQTYENKVSDENEDTRSVRTQASGASSKLDKAINVDLSHAEISNIEGLLESLSRRVRDVERIGRDFARVNNLADNDDSARAESVASHVSSTSSRRRENEQERVYDGETHSLISRQSVIIEGLTLETEELRKKCHVLEEELVTPVVEDLSQKLDQVEGKLEETETYCYQVVEENVELKSEIEGLESEISEVQDTFRDKDAKEFKKVKWELENLSKTCRNLQIKLGKAQAKASRLRQEKEEIEDQQREQTLWKTTAVVAAAALAAYHLLSRYK